MEADANAAVAAVVRDVHDFALFLVDLTVYLILFQVAKYGRIDALIQAAGITGGPSIWTCAPSLVIHCRSFAKFTPLYLP